MKKWLLIIACWSSSLIQAQTVKALRDAIQVLVADDDLKNASVGFYALDLDSNKIISGISSNKTLVPASTMKLVTTATALEMMGSGKRFSTFLKYSGEIDTNCVLHGNIYIVGGGDPCLGSPKFDSHYGDLIGNWAEEVRQQGIDSIDGRVIGDATIFNEQMIPSTWIWGDLGNYYGAGPCGLSIHENMCELTLQSGKKGDTTVISCVNPYIPDMTIDNYVKGMITDDDESYILGGPYQQKRVIKGGIPVNQEEFSVRGSIPDPAYLAAFELDMELRMNGMKIARSATTIRKLKNEEGVEDDSQRHIIKTTYSPRLSSIIEMTNMYSINLYAEHIMNQIGLFKYGSGDTGSGTQATTEFWKGRGLDTDGFYVYDGSGLSRFNAVTPRQLVGILALLYESKNYKIFLSTLPVAGKSGTLRNVGKGTAASGKVRAKSGTMTRVKSYAGYVTTKNKRNIAFALIVNNHNCSAYEMKKKMEKIMVKLAEIND
ncbi:MAG: D-alanyl-D-alanine carboxypeptidase/D-alanyl-D-alanine-endopeptidase [Flavobacteriales bacterium]|nr:D-alanyl-D-alanine carboxypeptidase/D-alanyl-D-alanine-endopeptidase [Flavobacteriales bacterium]